MKFRQCGAFPPSAAATPLNRVVRQEIYKALRAFVSYSPKKDVYSKHRGELDQDGGLTHASLEEAATVSGFRFARKGHTVAKPTTT